MKLKAAHPRPARPPITARPQLLVNGSDRQFRQLVHDLFSFLSLHTAIRDGYASLLGLPGSQYTILLCIQHLTADRPVGVREVAEHLHLSSSFVTTETNKLGAAGLLTKKRGTADRRAVSLALTARGNALLNSIAPIRRAVSNVQFECLSARDFAALAPLVGKLIPCGARALALLDTLLEHGSTAAASAQEVMASSARGKT